MHTSPYAQEMSLILARTDNTGKDEPNDTKPFADRQEPEAYDVYIEPDRVTVVKRPEPQPRGIAAIIPPQPKPYVAYIAMTMSLLLLSYLVTAACITVFFPPVITVTIIPTSQTLTFTGTVQLGRLLRPLTISQSLTVPTTGKGHQDAQSAIGYITFYNGLFSPQTIPAGTIVTGADGVQIITDQDAGVPAANPPSLGYVTVSAHTTHAGSNGNIQAYDINEACCSTAIKAVNTTPFHGGQNERNFQTVAKADIASVAMPLTIAVAQSMQGALNSQANQRETLLTLPCSSAVTPDHRVGDEAKEVTVLVSETCSAAAYDSQELTTRATRLVRARAGKKLGPQYCPFGTVHVTVLKASITSAATPPVFVSFQAQGTWTYGLSNTAQQRIKQLVAGKRKLAALHVLLSMPGIQDAAIHGIDDLTKLPKSVSSIHVMIVVKHESS
jgi:hypothetical protein